MIILKIIIIFVLGILIALMTLKHIKFSYTIIKTGKERDFTLIPITILAIILFLIIQSLK